MTICCYCDNALSCAVCGREQPDDGAEIQKMTDGYNAMRDALSWFDSHEVETKLGHLPQWVVTGREIKTRRHG